MTSFLDGLNPLVELFEELGIPYYIGGSVASIAYGMPRTTLDVDLIADIQAQHVTALVKHLQDQYYIQASDIYDAIIHRSSFNIVHLASMIKVDIFLAPDRPFDQSKAQRIRQGQLIMNESRLFNLTSPEDIILQKLEWYVLGGKVSERQWNDAQGVLKVQSDTLDLSYMRNWARHLNISELLEQAFQEAGIQK